MYFGNLILKTTYLYLLMGSSSICFPLGRWWGNLSNEVKYVYLCLSDTKEKKEN